MNIQRFKKSIKENKVLYRGLLILIVVFPFYASVTEERTRWSRYEINGSYLGGTELDQVFSIFCYENADTIPLQFDNITRALIERKKITLPDTGAHVSFNITYPSWLKIEKGRNIRHPLNVYSYWVDGTPHLSYEEYRNKIDKRNKFRFYKKLITAILSVLLLNLISKNWFSILDYTDRFTDKVNAHLDPVTTKSTGYQEYREVLEKEGYRGSFRPPIEKPNIRVRPQHDILPVKFSLGQHIFGFLILLGIMFFLNRSIDLQNIIILFLLYSILIFLEFKKGHKITLTSTGISWYENRQANWDSIEYAYIYYADSKSYLLLKPFDNNQPILIPIHNMTLTPKQIGYLIAKYVKN